MTHNSCFQDASASAQTTVKTFSNTLSVRPVATVTPQGHGQVNVPSPATSGNIATSSCPSAAKSGPVSPSGPYG